MEGEAAETPPPSKWGDLTTRWVDVVFSTADSLASVVQFVCVGALAFGLDWTVRWLEANTKTSQGLLVMAKAVAYILATYDFLIIVFVVIGSLEKRWRNR